MTPKREREDEIGRSMRIAGRASRPMEERMAALDDLVDRGAVEELSTIARGSGWPDDMREEAVLGLVDLDATEELSAIAESDRCPPWLRGIARELMR